MLECLGELCRKGNSAKIMKKSKKHGVVGAWKAGLCKKKYKKNVFLAQVVL